MKIGIISDTHGSMAAIRKVLATAPPVECWIHCGDYAMDANALHNMINQTVYAVSGNCDVMRGPVEAKPDCCGRSASWPGGDRAWNRTS